MGKLILQTQISIDGFIADSYGATDWMLWNWGEHWNWDNILQNRITDITKSASTILITRQMAEEGFVSYWKEIFNNPKDDRYNLAKHITETSKLVASSQLTEEKNIPGGWSNVEIIDKPLDKTIMDFKNYQESNMIVYGGASLVSYLIDKNLIDEFFLVVNPVALGKGLSIFKYKTKLKLIESSRYDCGIILSHYKH